MIALDNQKDKTIINPILAGELSGKKFPNYDFSDSLNFPFFSRYIPEGELFQAVAPVNSPLNLELMYHPDKYKDNQQ